MSAEREIFKELGKLCDEKREFKKYYFEKGKPLIKRAIREFMDDHPEVRLLRFSATEPAVFYVDLGDGPREFTDLAESNPKLSVCLGAMASHFTALDNVCKNLFGTAIVTVTHENVGHLCE